MNEMQNELTLDLNSLTRTEQTNFLFISAPTKMFNEYILTMQIRPFRDIRNFILKRIFPHRPLTKAKKRIESDSCQCFVF